MSTARALWLYVVVVAVVAIGAYPLLVHDYGPFSRQEIGIGLMLLAASPIAELLVVHVHVRKSAHSFSLLELPLTFGLMLAPPLMLVVAYTLGSGFVLVAHRRQPPMKLLFNTATFGLTATIAAVVYRALPHGGGVLDPLTWVAAVSGAMCASIIGSLLVFGVIAIAERRLAFRDLRTSVVFGLLTSVGGASMGVSTAIIWDVAPMALPLVCVPLGAVFMGNRAYESERQRRESLELVYETSRELREAEQSDDGLFAALKRCLDSLPCDYVRLLVPMGLGGIVDLRVDPHGNHRSVISADSVQGILEVSSATGRAARVHAPQPEVPRDPQADLLWARIVQELDDADLAEALVAPLSSGTEALGALVVASHGGAFRTFNDADTALVQTICNGVASHTRLTRLAFEDVLTGLPNRRRLLGEVDAFCANPGDSNRVFLLIDMDDFKGINDTFGHAMGDAVLVEAAARLKAAAPGAMVARLGGDEFAVFGDVPADGWQSLTDEILRAFAPPLETPEGPFTLGVSIGVALADGVSTSSMLLRNADTALYEAKRLGKGRAQSFSQAMHDAVARKYAMTDALRGALGAGELDTVIQPVVTLRDRKIVGGEALSRWESAQLGRVAPDEFVRVAEEHGLAGALAQHIIDGAMACLAGVPGAGITMSLNLSPGDLTSPRVLATLHAAAAKVAPHTLGIEITERLLVQDPGVFQALADLRTAGLKVYIDDFGTGYSSLSYLKDLPVDVLKVPREFVREIEHDARSLALVSAIVAMGRALGLGVVAEGIENEAQLKLLVHAGVDEGQGYLFSAPVLPVEFLSGLRRQRWPNAA
ncbi:MAG: EAL domain-containing protein [Dehalococcoidia bacterium]|nr:EAL domain-containing protein [Dehalococcoidia bacterium]